MNQFSDENELASEDALEGLSGGSIQGLAVPTLLLGLLSFFALFKTIFWIIPLVAVVLGAISLRSIAANPEKFGRSVVVLGIMLALFFGTWAPARYFSRERWIASQGREYAERWLKLIDDNRLQEAHQLHLARSQRHVKGIPLDEYYRKQEYAASDFDSFFQTEPLKTLVDRDADSTLEFQRCENYFVDSYSDEISLRYVLRHKSKGRKEVIPMLIVMVRNPDRRAGDAPWYVHEVKDVP